MFCLQAKEGATIVQLFAARKGKGIVAGSKVIVFSIMVVVMKMGMVVMNIAAVSLSTTHTLHRSRLCYEQPESRTASPKYALTPNFSAKISSEFPQVHGNRNPLNTVRAAIAALQKVT